MAVQKVIDFSIERIAAMTDLKTMTYNELVALENEVKVAIESRSEEEKAQSKKDWLKCEQGGAKHLARIEELRKKYDKISARCNKSKNVVLRVKMNVEASPIRFDELLQSRWEQSVGDIFNSDCSGELLNPEACGDLADDIQEQIDNVMGDVCGDIIGIHGDLNDDLESFVEEWNQFIDEFNECNKFAASPGDVVKANAKKKAAKAKAKGKK